MKKKLLAMLLVAVMIAGMLAGCNATPVQTDPAGPAQSTTKPVGDDSQPAQQEERKLVVGIQSYTTITDYEDNYLTKLLEEKLNCELEMMLLPTDNSELETKIALMAASPEELPDVILASNMTQQVVTEYGNNGIFLDLTQYVGDAEKMPYFNAIPEEYRKAMINATSGDGKVYALGTFAGDAWSQTPYRIYINEVWLENLKLEMPKTTDELRDVLNAFATQDPNRNNIQDEIPIYGTMNAWGTDPTVALMNSFVYYNPGTENGLALDESGEAVIAPFTSEEFKSGLAYMNALYDDGVFSDSIFTDDTTQFKATLNNEACNLVGVVVSGSYGNWSDAANNANFNELTLLDPIAGPDGVAYSPWNDYTLQRNMVITSNCKNVDLAIEFGDIFYESSMSITTRFGEEGVDWTADPEITALYTSNNVEAGFSETVSAFLYNDIWAEQTNKFWHAFNPRFMDPVFNYADESLLKETFAEEGGKLKTNQARVQSLKSYYYAHPDYIIPALNYTEEEFEITGTVSLNIKDYLNQSIAQFITGERDVEAEWEDYLAELDNLGLQEWLATAQAAYDRTK